MRKVALILLLSLPIPALGAGKAPSIRERGPILEKRLSHLKQLDKRHVVATELDQARQWLDQASASNTEEKAHHREHLFQLVEEQLRLVRDLMELSKLQMTIRKMVQKLDRTRKWNQATLKKLKERRSYLDVLRTTRE